MKMVINDTSQATEQFNTSEKYDKSLLIICTFRIFACNVRAVLNVSQIFAQKMIENKIAGSIVNVSSQVDSLCIFYQGLGLVVIEHK